MEEQHQDPIVEPISDLPDAGSSEWTQMEEAELGELDGDSSSSLDDEMSGYLPIGEDQPEEMADEVDETLQGSESRAREEAMDASALAKMLPRRAQGAQSVLAQPVLPDEGMTGFSAKFDEIDFETVQRVASQIKVCYIVISGCAFVFSSFSLKLGTRGKKKH
jgi:hypothetical protein